MNRTRTNDRSDRVRKGSADPGKGSSRYATQASHRSGGPARSGGHGHRPAAVRGEFALPRSITPALPAVEAFPDLGMPEPLLAELGKRGVTVPFPIQGATLPNSLAGRDVLGRGRTGSGKTLAFGLALHARTAGRRAEPRQPLGLILVPTRELAQQVTDALAPYGRSVRLRLTTVVGGMSIGRQAGALRGRLMSDAGIRPQTAEIHSGGEALSRITGAQAPSGIPVVLTAPVVERAAPGPSSRGRRRHSAVTRRTPVRRPALDTVA